MSEDGEPTADHDRLLYEAGFLRGLSDRVDKISSRIDTHIASCSTRYLVLVGAVAAASTALGIIMYHSR